MVIYELVVCLFFLNVVRCTGGTAPHVKLSTSNNEACASRVAHCEANPASARRTVCGTDGKTYQSRCHLMKIQCSGDPIAVARKGACDEEQSSCLTSLRYALNDRNGKRSTYIPRCRNDGTYAAVQCAAGGKTSGCWCVTPDGKPLPDTAATNGRPDCTRADEHELKLAAAESMGRLSLIKERDPKKKPPTARDTGKSHTRRRSSVRGQRNKKSCTRADRGQFNSNLIKIFSEEYERARSEPSGTKTEPTNVANWKFRELDRDRSDSLQKSEYRGLRRLIRKVVKPKRCARAWARGCDGDGDGEIARAEWVECLLANPEPPAPDYEDSGPDVEPDYNEEEPPPDPGSSVLPGIVRNSFAPDGSDPENRREDEANDCLTDRQAVLDEQKAGDAALYVPECTGDGRYARAQCYRSTGYCWCVHQDTGKPIPGSSVKDRRPDCDAAPQHASPMRGCPEPMKANFLRDLMSFLVAKMASSTNGTGPGEMVKWGASKEEQAATWTYVMLDKDKNKALERREWKAYHQLISNMEPLKRCGRKLPRYCDVNHDTKISITEWMACLEVTQASLGVTTEAAKAPSNPRRKGPNPLESFLKADD